MRSMRGLASRLIWLIVGMAPLSPCCATAAQQPIAAQPEVILHTVQTPGWGTTVTVRIAGEELPFLFDTGGGVTVVTAETAALLKCHIWGQVTGFRLSGERVNSPRCDNAHMMVGSDALLAPIAMVFDINRFSEGATTKLAGSLALDAFAGRAITIRPKAHEIVVETPASLRLRVRDSRGIPIRLVRDAEGVALTVDAAVSTRDGFAWMELDTGNSGPLAIGEDVAGLLGLNQDAKATQPVHMELPGGAVVQGPARVGDFIMDGDIGASFLNQWDLTLDLGGSGRAWIRPASASRTDP